MSNLTDFIGGGGGIDPREFIRVDITTSQTWTVPAHKGKMFVICSGGGGSGASMNTASTNTAQGGGGGFISSGIFDLSEGDNINVTIGAGGASVSGTKPGNAGGTTNFGTLLTAGGGTGGTSKISGKGSTRGGLALAGSYHTDYAYISASNGESLFKNFFNLLDVTASGGTSESNVGGRNASGGGAGLIGNGGNGRASSSGGAGGIGAGGGAGGYNNSSGAGGDGIVIVFYEEA